MHDIKRMGRPMTRDEVKQKQQEWKVAETIKGHMQYICAIVLYDKMGMTWRQLDNCYKKLYHLTQKWRDDDNHNITSESLLNYAKAKKLDLHGAVKLMPRADRLALADMKKPIRTAAGVCDSELLACLMMITPILKETYRYSNDKMNEFYNQVAYIVGMYNTKLPKENRMVFDDEYIRQIFIEEQGFDMEKGDYVSEV